MSILIKGIPLGGYEISIMKDGERYRARVDGIWCEVEEIPTTDTDSDTISRAKAIKALSTITMYKGSIPYDTAVMRIEELPSAQPERIRGRWERDGHHIKCDQCGEWMCDRDREGWDYPKNFCPNCGAEMEVTT